MSEIWDVTRGYDESDPEVASYKAKYQPLDEEIALQQQTIASLEQAVDNLKQQLAKEGEKLKALQEQRNVLSMDWWKSRRDHCRQKVTRSPDLVLKALFRQMTPIDQMIASTVCRRWFDLVPEVTRLRRSLAIILDCTNRISLTKAEHTFNHLDYGKDCEFLKSLLKADGSPMYPTMRLTKWNSLQVGKCLSPATLQSIVGYFTGIKQLQLYSRQCVMELYDDQGISPLYCHLSGYLERWSDQLTTLHLAIHEIEPGNCYDHDHMSYSDDSDWDIWKPLPDQLVTAINGLSSLKHLSIKVKAAPLPDLPILAQLDQFNCRAYEQLEFFSQLRRHGQVKPTRIGVSPEFGGDEIGLLSEHIRRRFVRVERFSCLSTVCTRFRSLTSLELAGFKSDTTVYVFFSLLSQLRQLQFVHMYKCLSFIQPDNQPNRILAQVKSLKVLRLFNPINSHHDLELLNIPWTMPNLEVLQLDLDYLSRCTKCAIESFSDKTKVKNCLRQLFAPLKANCAQLRLLHYSLHHYRGCSVSVDDLFAAQ